MTDPRAPVLGLLLTAVAVALSVAATSARAAPGNGWCGPSDLADWVCGWEGESVLTPPAQPEEPLRLRSTVALPRGARVKTAPGSRAHLTFRSQANCAVGGKSGGPSEVVARWEPDVLMRQIVGDSVCTIRGRQAPVTTFCEPSERKCPVLIRAEGTYLLEGPGALPNALSTVVEEQQFSRHGRLVVCNGTARIKVRGEQEEAFGSADGHDRFVIEIDEAYAYAAVEVNLPGESGSASAFASIVNLTVVGTVPGPGVCQSSVVHEEERSVET